MSLEQNVHRYSDNVVQSESISQSNRDILRRKIHEPSIIQNFESSIKREIETLDETKKTNEVKNLWKPSTLSNIPWCFHPFPSSNDISDIPEEGRNEKNENCNKLLEWSQTLPRWDLNKLRQIQNTRFADVQVEEGIRYARLSLSSSSNSNHQSSPFNSNTIITTREDGYMVKAEYYYQEALKACPTHKATLLAYGALCCNKQSSPEEVEKGKEMWKKVLKIDPENESATQYLNLVKAREERNLKKQQQQNESIYQKQNLSINLDRYKKDILIEKALLSSDKLDNVPSLNLYSDSNGGNDENSENEESLPPDVEKDDSRKHRYRKKGKKYRRKSRSRSRKRMKKRRYEIDSDTTATTTTHRSDNDDSCNNDNSNKSESSQSRKKRRKRSSSRKHERYRNRHRKSTYSHKSRKRSDSQHRSHRRRRHYRRHHSSHSSEDDSHKKNNNGNERDSEKEDMVEQVKPKNFVINESSGNMSSNLSESKANSSA